MPKEPKGAREPKPVEELSLTVQAAATPERVAAVASLFQAAMLATGGAGVVTMTVRNFALGSKVRAWNADDARRLLLVMGVIENPMRSIQEHPERRVIADAIAERAAALAGVGGVFMHRRRRIARLDQNFVHSLRAAAATPRTHPSLRGSSEMTSLVLRVGSAREDSEERARVLLPGQREYSDVKFAESEREKFCEAVRTKQPQRIQFEAAWEMAPDGMRLVAKSVVLLSARAWEPLTGFALLSAVQLSAETVAATLRGEES